MKTKDQKKVDALRSVIWEMSDAEFTDEELQRMIDAVSGESKPALKE